MSFTATSSPTRTSAFSSVPKADMGSTSTRQGLRVEPSRGPLGGSLPGKGCSVLSLKSSAEKEYGDDDKENMLPMQTTIKKVSKVAPGSSSSDLATSGDEEVEYLSASYVRSKDEKKELDGGRICIPRRFIPIDLVFIKS